MQATGLFLGRRETDYNAVGRPDLHGRCMEFVNLETLFEHCAYAVAPSAAG